MELMCDGTTLQACVEGRVQGVGFRYFTVERATSHGLLGYVRNLPDGSVEVRAEGARQDLEALLVDLRCGPGMSRVSDVIASFPEGATEGFSEFGVR